MLIVFIKACIIFILVFAVIRLMGKRQLGEMQPFELVITLIIAEVACIPMNDPYIPFYNAIVPIVTLAMLQVFMSFLSRKSIKFRRLLSGHSIIVVDKNGINYENLKKMNLNVNDLLEAVRADGHFDFNDIQYAIFETNGKVCVLEKPQNPNELPPKEALLPIAVYIDGKWEEDNVQKAGVEKAAIEKAAKTNGVEDMKEILYCDIRQNGLIYLSPKHKKCFTATVKIEGGADW